MAGEKPSRIGRGPGVKSECWLRSSQSAGGSRPGPDPRCGPPADPASVRGFGPRPCLPRAGAGKVSLCCAVVTMTCQSCQAPPRKALGFGVFISSFSFLLFLVLRRWLSASGAASRSGHLEMMQKEGQS